MRRSILPLATLLASLGWVSGCAKPATAADDAGSSCVADGCADDGGSADAAVDAGPSPVDAASYCGLLAQAVCDRRVRCGYISEPYRAQCEGEVSSACGGPILPYGVDAGTIGFDPLQAGECLNEWKNLLCSIDRPFYDPPVGCVKVVVGKGAAQSPCYAGLECGPGTFCYGTPSQCPQQCVAYRKKGETCAAAGEVCDPQALRCDYSAPPYLCVERGALGAACSGAWECLPNLDCIKSRCAAPPSPSPRDGPCATAGAYPLCQQGFYCNRPSSTLPGVCQPTIALGGGCASYDQCQDNLFCDMPPFQGSSGLCAPLRAPGERCGNFSGGVCQHYLQCDLTTHTCASYPGPGSSCESVYMCAAGAYCDYSQVQLTCLAQKKIGDTCGWGGQCLSGRCAGTCQPACLP